MFFYILWICLAINRDVRWVSLKKEYRRENPPPNISDHQTLISKNLMLIQQLKSEIEFNKVFDVPKGNKWKTDYTWKAFVTHKAYLFNDKQDLLSIPDSPKMKIVIPQDKPVLSIDKEEFLKIANSLNLSSSTPMEVHVTQEVTMTEKALSGIDSININPFLLTFTPKVYTMLIKSVPVSFMRLFIEMGVSAGFLITSSETNQRILFASHQAQPLKLSGYIFQYSYLWDNFYQNSNEGSQMSKGVEVVLSEDFHPYMSSQCWLYIVDRMENVSSNHELDSFTRTKLIIYHNRTKVIAYFINILIIGMISLVWYHLIRATGGMLFLRAFVSTSASISLILHFIQFYGNFREFYLTSMCITAHASTSNMMHLFSVFSTLMILLILMLPLNEIFRIYGEESNALIKKDLIDHKLFEGKRSFGEKAAATISQISSIPFRNAFSLFLFTTLWMVAEYAVILFYS